MSDRRELNKLIIRSMISRGLCLIINDKCMNKLLFRIKLKKKINLSNPRTFAEKLIYLKLHYQNPLLPVCVDKYYVADYIKACGYEDILKETYAVYNHPDEIDINDLPDVCFIQCTHMSKFNFVLHKNDTAKLEQIKKTFKPLMKYNHYWWLRERCYKNVTPRIICSQYLKEEGKEGLTDYKFYCFSGEPKYFMVSYGELEHNVKSHKFDMNWNSIDEKFKKSSSIEASQIIRPKNFDKMIEIAKKLSEPFPHVRVDFYNIDGKIYFGELTFFSSGGFVNVYSEKMNEEIGSWINLSKYKKDFI